MTSEEHLVPDIRRGKVQGEMMDVTEASLMDLAQWRLQYNQNVLAALEMRDIVDMEVVRRCDREAVQHIDVGAGLTFYVNSPLPEEKWNIETLKEALSTLVKEGTISKDAASRCLDVEYKPRAVGINQIRKLGDRTGSLLSVARELHPRKRTARLRDPHSGGSPAMAHRAAEQSNQ